jgi:hypothetical protein
MIQGKEYRAGCRTETPGTREFGCLAQLAVNQRGKTFRTRISGSPENVVSNYLSNTQVIVSKGQAKSPQSGETEAS